MYRHIPFPRGSKWNGRRRGHSKFIHSLKLSLVVDSMNTPSSAPLLFLRSMLQNPREVGALFPSSPVLAELIAAQVDPRSPAVLEIGAGTGPVTRALLQRGVDPERLYVIERDPSLVNYLRRQFPGIHVRCADAAHAGKILSDASVGKAKTVISGIPLRNLSPGDRAQMVRAMMKAVAPGGQLIQFTYAIGCPIPNRRLGLHAECVGRVWANLPPAAVWRFTHPQPPRGKTATA